MNIKPRALMISAAVGFALLFVIQLINLATTFLAPMPSFDLDNPTAMQTDPLTTVLGCVVMICGGVVYLGIGALYSYMHAREETMTAVDGAIGGAAAAAVAGIINGITRACLTALIVPMIVEQTLGNVSPDMLAGGMIGGIGTVVVASCVSITIGTLLSAGTGAGVGAMMANK